MTKTLNMLRLTLLVVVALSLAACDAAEQNLDWDTGSSLAVVGPLRNNSTTAIDDNGTASGAPVYLPLNPNNLADESVCFYVVGYNPNKTYTWAYNSQSAPALQGGEFTRGEVPEAQGPATYTIEVSNGQFSGSRQFTAMFPNLPVQIGRFNVFETLTDLLGEEDVDVAEALGGEGPFTVFAPTNAAFDALGEEALEDIEAEELAAILRQHAVAGALTMENLTSGATFTTLEGGTLTIGRSGDQVTVSLNGGTPATLTAPMRVRASNGAIFAIDTVLMPAV